MDAWVQMWAVTSESPFPYPVSNRSQRSKSAADITTPRLASHLIVNDLLSGSRVQDKPGPAALSATTGMPYHSTTFKGIPTSTPLASLNSRAECQFIALNPAAAACTSETPRRTPGSYFHPSNENSIHHQYPPRVTWSSLPRSKSRFAGVYSPLLAVQSNPCDLYIPPTRFCRSISIAT